MVVERDPAQFNILKQIDVTNLVTSGSRTEQLVVAFDQDSVEWTKSDLYFNTNGASSMQVSIQRIYLQSGTKGCC